MSESACVSLFASAGGGGGHVSAFAADRLIVIALGSVPLCGAPALTLLWQLHVSCLGRLGVLHAADLDPLGAAVACVCVCG